jgi:membrane carboxypeptidase/penicillin-binding protein
VERQDWTKANTMGQKYIQLKQYSQELNSTFQRELPWNERLSEWFAEDIRQIMLEKIAESKGILLPPNDSSFGIYKGVGPEKTKEVNEFLEKLIFTE